MKRFSLLALCAALTPLAVQTNAAVLYWDPQGSAAPTSANEASTWTNTVNQWSGTSSLTASTVPWASGDAADFIAGTTTIGTPVVVTVNSAINIGGIFNGSLTAYGAPVTIKGTGSFTLASGADAFDNGGTSTTAITIPMTGSGQMAMEGTAQVYLSATNTFSGGVILGFPGVANYSSTLVFSNGNALGTGPIQMTPSGSGAALQAGGTAAMTVANTFNATNAILNIVGTTGGLTFSGPWVLGATPVIGSGGNGNLIAISGVMSGIGGFTKYNPSTIVLSGANTYTGQTTVSNGVLSITADNNLGAIPTVANYIVYLSGGELNASNTFTLNSKRLISLTANSTLGVSSGQTLTYGGIIGGTAGWSKFGNGTLALTGTSAYSGITTVSNGTLEADCQSGSTTSTNSVTVLTNSTLSGLGLVGGVVTVKGGTIAPGTAAGTATLTLGSGLIMTNYGIYSWNLASNNTSSAFSSIALNSGNLTLGGTSKLAINFTGTASAPATNNPFWLVPEAWPVVTFNGAAGNSNSTSFASIQNGTNAAGYFTNYPSASGQTLLYQPNFAYFTPLNDSGPNFVSGENLILTNFSGLALNVWASTNASLSISNWTLVGQMAEQTLGSAKPGYSAYTININPTVSPTYYIAGNSVHGPYLPATVTASIVTTPDFANFTVQNTNVTINAAGVLELEPYPAVFAPGAAVASVSGQFQFQFSGETNINYTIQASSDMLNWSNVYTGFITSSPVIFADPATTNFGFRFYRVVF